MGSGGEQHRVAPAAVEGGVDVNDIVQPDLLLAPDASAGNGEVDLLLKRAQKVGIDHVRELDVANLIQGATLRSVEQARPGPEIR